METYRVLACQYLESFRDNLREERWAPAASDALHLADMVAAIVLARHGLPVPGSHRGRLAMLRRASHELARVHGRLQDLYSRMSYLGLDGGLARGLEGLVEALLGGLERHGERLPC